MRITLLGTANPMPQLERAGTSICLEIGNDVLLIDCGPMAVYRLVEARIDMTEIETVFFTHHHFDHNAAFFQFAIYGWRRGRRSLTVYGPEGTSELLEGLDVVYRSHIESWKPGMDRDDPGAGIDDIDVHRTTADLTVEGDGWRCSALPVDHSLETYAYRFEETATGRSFVFSGDTTPVTALSDFASNADVLVHEANDRDPSESLLDEAAIPDEYLEPPFDAYYRSRSNAVVRTHLGGIHSTPSQAAEIAQDAGVDTLVLTHLNPYRDEAAMKESAETGFDGEVHIATDGLTIFRD